MRYPQCQTENPNSRKFCRRCGNRLGVVCPVCSSENLPGDEYCGNCGGDLRATTPSPSLDTSRPSCIPKFFADVVSHASFFERLDLEEVRHAPGTAMHPHHPKTTSREDLP